MTSATAKANAARRRPTVLLATPSYSGRFVAPYVAGVARHAQSTSGP